MLKLLKITSLFLKSQAYTSTHLSDSVNGRGDACKTECVHGVIQISKNSYFIHKKNVIVTFCCGLRNAPPPPPPAKFKEKDATLMENPLSS